jgi:hypothetical protein
MGELQAGGVLLGDRGKIRLLEGPLAVEARAAYIAPADLEHGLYYLADGGVRERRWAG